jgi:putative sigma-54 modulation protein
MRTKIASIHFKASDSLKEFAAKEVRRLNRLSDDILNCDIEFTYTKSAKEARVNLNANGSLLHASETSDDFKKSIALAVDKLEQQLKKRKGKRIAKRAGGV